MKTEFIQAVSNHELAKVRMMLSNELLLDPRGRTFSEMLALAKDSLPDLFEENRESTYDIPSDKNLWTDTLVSKVKRDLNSNFSVEKLALFQEMAMWVGKDKASNLEAEEKSQASNDSHGSGNETDSEQTACHYQKKQKCIKTAVGTITTIGGAALAVYAIGAGKVMLTVLGGGAIVVGGVILYSAKKLS